MKEFRDLNIELRDQDQEEFIVYGRPITYDTYSDFGSFVETIERGSATKSIEDSDVYVVFNHNMNDPLARTKNGTLTLTEDEEGVLMRADLSSSNRSKEVYQQIKSGLIDKMSFAFTVDKDADVRWEQRDIEGQNKRVRIIKNFQRLYEVSPVLFPAYESTELYARSIEAIKQSMPEEMRTKEVESDTSTDVDEVSTDTQLELLRYKYRFQKTDLKKVGDL